MFTKISSKTSSHTFKGVYIRRVTHSQHIWSHKSPLIMICGCSRDPRNFRSTASFCETTRLFFLYETLYDRSLLAWSSPSTTKKLNKWIWAFEKDCALVFVLWCVSDYPRKWSTQSALNMVKKSWRSSPYFQKFQRFLDLLTVMTVL